MTHPAIADGSAAVVTGAAGGIGLAISKRLAGDGVRVFMLDLPGQALDAAAASVDGATGIGCDVSDADAVDAVARDIGPVTVLVNNAAAFGGGGVWKPRDGWERAFDVNFWGVINGVRSFVPAMIDTGTPGLVVNVGSKQGITNPPGNTAYNITKAAVKTYTEALQHELRSTPDCRVTAHLLIPGWTSTDGPEQKPGSWHPDQVADFMVQGLAAGDFYILCPDGETTREMDAKRILWGAGDIAENRSPLSRWDPAYKAAFQKYMT
jgi:NAD(P)-dependent dehydrogenase (short-subunit alcohol dehydrogenase family)